MLKLLVLPVLLILLVSIISHRISQTGVAAEMVVTPLWETIENDSNTSFGCYLEMDERNATITMFGDSFHQCSLRVLTSFATLIKITENPTEDYLLYVERNNLPEHGSYKFASVNGLCSSICETVITHYDIKINLIGNVSVEISETARETKTAQCVEEEAAGPPENQTLPECRINEYNDAITCNDQGNPLCVVSFPTACNSVVIRYMEAVLNCMVNKSFAHNQSAIVVIPSLIVFLDLSYNNIVEIDVDAFQNLDGLQSLYLEYNRVQVLPKGVFGSLYNLNHLYLKGNQLEYLDPALFVGLKMLSYLDVSRNKMKYITTRMFEGLKNLNKLYLGRNQMSTIEACAFCGLNQLNTLNLYRNHIPTLEPGAFDGLDNLVKLDIGGNRFERLDNNSFKNLTNLRYLYLDNNQLYSLAPRVFRGLGNLTLLWISENALETLDSKIFQELTKLTRLYLYSNRLSSLDRNLLTGLKQLDVFTVSGNNLKELPRGLFEDLLLINVLSLGGNMFEDLPSRIFHGMFELKTLYLEDNNIEYLETDVFADLEALNTLTLNGNRLKRIHKETFANTLNLAILDLSNNDLENIPSLGNLENLQFLSLKDNDLQGIVGVEFSGLQDGLQMFVSQHEICDCYVPKGVNCSASKSRSPYLTCDRLLSDRVLVAMMWLIGLSALAGNLFVLVYKNKQNKNKVQSLLLNNLAASDLLMGIYMIVIAIADIYFGTNFPMQAEKWRTGIPCKVAGALSILSSEASVFFVTVISLDRFVSIKYPHSKYKLRSKSTVVTATVVWAFAIALGIVPSFLAGKNPNFYDNSHVCIGLPLALYESYTPYHVDKLFSSKYKNIYIETSRSVSNGKEPGMYFSTAVFLGLNFVCYLIIVCCYIEIIRTVYKSSKRAGLNKEMKAQIRLTLKVAAIVATDFICWFPVIILGILVQTRVLTLPPSVFAWSVTFILPINSALNPYLYTISDIISARRKLKDFESRTQTEQSRTGASQRMSHGPNGAQSCRTISSFVPGQEASLLPNVPVETVESNV